MAGKEDGLQILHCYKSKEWWRGSRRCQFIAVGGGIELLRRMKRSAEGIEEKSLPVRKAGTTVLDKVINAIRCLKSSSGSSTKAIISFISKEEGVVNENAIKKVDLKTIMIFVN